MSLMIFVVLLVAYAIYAIMTAPEGYEDESGFHLDRSPDDEDKFFF